MVRPRRERLVQELGGDLAATIANLQARLEAQENENRNLWAQLEQRDQEQERRRAPPVMTGKILGLIRTVQYLTEILSRIVSSRILI